MLREQAEEYEVKEGGASLCQDPSMSLTRQWLALHYLPYVGTCTSLPTRLPQVACLLHTHDCGTQTTATITDRRSISVVSISMLQLCRRDMRPWFHRCKKARPQTHAQHHNDCTRFTCPKAVLGGGALPTLGRVAGRVRLHILYSAQWMDIDRRSPQFTAQREDIRVFSSKPPCTL